jgi:transposase
MKFDAGIDLHSTNNYVGIIDDQDQKLYGKRLPNELNSVLMALEPFNDTLEGVWLNRLTTGTGW